MPRSVKLSKLSPVMKHVASLDPNIPVVSHKTRSCTAVSRQTRNGCFLPDSIPLICRIVILALNRYLDAKLEIASSELEAGWSKQHLTGSGHHSMPTSSRSSPRHEAAFFCIWLQGCYTATEGLQTPAPDTSSALNFCHKPVSSQDKLAPSTQGRHTNGKITKFVKTNQARHPTGVQDVRSRLGLRYEFNRHRLIRE